MGKCITGLPTSDLEHVDGQCAPLWERLRGARIFVTGGSGFVGRWLLESLLLADARRELGCLALVLTRNPERLLNEAPHLSGLPQLSFRRGDIRDFEFPPGTFTHMIHGAADAALPDEAETLETITGGTARLLECARRSGAADVLLLSSGAVYGPQPPSLDRIPEDYSGKPQPGQSRSAYAEGKRRAELLCGEFAARTAVRIKIARLFTFSGPNLPLAGSFAFGNFLRDSLERRPILVRGDGAAVRSYLYAADLAVWLWSILLRAPSGRPYNVGSDEPVSIVELARAFAGLAGGVEVHVEGKLSPAGRYVPDTDRARIELGLERRVSLEQGIARSLAWRPDRRVR